MELDALKSIWQSHTALLTEAGRRSEADIRRIIRQRSRRALSKINRSIAIEVGLLIALGIWTIRNLLVEDTWQLASWISLVFIIASLGFYAWKYRQLNRVQFESANLKEALMLTTQTMAGYMRLYYYAGMIVVPVLGVSGVLYGVYVAAGEEGKTLGDLSLHTWLVIGAVMAVYAALTILFTRWYVQKLYGVHHQELQACLLELTEEI